MVTFEMKMSLLVYTIALCSLILTSFVCGQNEEVGLKYCNAVCNCNADSPSDPHSTRTPLSQGPPGKSGAKGNIGFPGQKGDKGVSGLKGQKGEDVDEAVLLPQMLGALSATSCQELKVKYRISDSGYYLMRDARSKTSVYNYCDFRRYTDVTTCTQLHMTHNITMKGFFLLGARPDNFQYCSEPVFEGIYTCQRLQNRYPSDVESGFYKFKSPGGNPFRVFCNFSQTPVATELHHDMMEERLIESSCESDGCFVAAPSYGIPASSMLKIVENSESCRQYIKLRCQGVVLSWTKSFNRGWWIARNGERMKYWGGTTLNGYCGCGETGTCIDNSKKCNCDQNSESLITSDEGYLTDKTKLPLKEIKIGDMGGSGEIAWYAIGKLECFGQV